METHYVCTGGCGAVLEMPGACGDSSCLMYNMDLLQCNCEDGHHDKVLKAVPDDIAGDDEEGWGDKEGVEVDADELMKWEEEFGDDREEAYN